MTADPKRPLTSLTFDYLPNDDHNYIVANHGGFVRDQFNPSAFSVRTVLHRIPKGFRPGRPVTAVWVEIERYVPLSDLLYFGAGSIFRQQRHRGRAKFQRVARVSGLCGVPIGVSQRDGRFELDARGHYASDREISTRGIPCYFLTGVEQPTILTMVELIRFYFTGFGRVSKSVLDAVAGQFTGDFWDPAESGFEDDETFVISPNANYADIVTATQFAVILASPDLLSLSVKISSILNDIGAFQSGVTPLLEPLDGASNPRVTCTYGPYIDRTDEEWTSFPASGRIRLVQQILSDAREMPFENLVIRDPRPTYSPIGLQEEAEGAGRGPSETWMSVVESNAGKERRPSHVLRSGFDLASAFTSLRKVKIRVDREAGFYEAKTTKKTLSVNKLASGSDEEAPKVGRMHSTGDGGWSGGAVHIREIPKMSKRRMFGGTAYIPGERRLLFTAQEFKKFLIPDPAAQALQDPVCAVFAEAVRETTDVGIEDHGPIAATFGGPEFFLAIDQLCLGGKKPRPLVLSRFEVGNMHGVAIELSRTRSQDIFSIGMVLKLTGSRVTDGDCADILEHCRYRMAMRGQVRKPSEAYAGIWPTDVEFADAVGSRLIHSPRRRHAHFLAEDLVNSALDFALER